jgi:exodeoxyribonuclease VII large subunit
MVASRDIYTVSRLNREARGILEAGLPSLWITGELSNLSRPASGHWYFTLKDEDAQVRCAMFRQRNLAVRTAPRDGLQVLLRARVGLYEARGEFQLVVDHMEEAGEGELRRRFEALKQKLAAEGLFDEARKRVPPRFPRRVGIVTSATGAALRDVLHVLRRRFPAVPVLLYPVPVQGSGAAREIAAMLALADGRAEVDVLLLVRGGGSLEDLWAFNDEMLARTIAASKVPVISAVGHEVDFTIADFVADLRAPTPSAAAELVVREKQAVAESVADLTRRLGVATARTLARQRDRLLTMQRRRVLTDPARPLRELERRVDDARARLRRAMTAAMRHAAHRFELSTQGLRNQSPVLRTLDNRRQLTRLSSELHRSVARELDRSRHRLRVAVGRLDSLSPLAVLSRGYSLTRQPDGTVVRTAQQVSAGDEVSVLLHEGSLQCRVTATKERDERPQV